MLEAWRSGDDYAGYAILWRSVYEYVQRLVAGNTSLAARILLVRYEDLCDDPENEFARILTFCQLDEHSSALRHALPEVTAPAHDAQSRGNDTHARVWQETCDLAEQFGYKSRADDKNV